MASDRQRTTLLLVSLAVLIVCILLVLTEAHR